MKISEFRKLIREEIRKVVQEGTEMSEIAEYFGDYGVKLTPKFDLKAFAKDIQQSPKKAAVLLCNLEDTKVMKDVAKGVYDSFDMFDDSQFNDSYDDMMRDLNIRDTATNRVVSEKTIQAVLIDLGDYDRYDVTSLRDLNIPNSVKSLVRKPKTSIDPEDEEANGDEVDQYMNSLKQALLSVGKKVVPRMSLLAQEDGKIHLKLPAKPTSQIMSKLTSIYNGAKSIKFVSA